MVLALAYYAISYFPGGSAGLKFLSSTLTSSVFSVRNPAVPIASFLPCPERRWGASFLEGGFPTDDDRWPKMVRRNLVLALLCLTVLAPIVLYTDRLSAASNPSCECPIVRERGKDGVFFTVLVLIVFCFPSTANDEALDEASALSFGTNQVGEPHALSQVAFRILSRPFCLRAQNESEKQHRQTSPRNNPEKRQTILRKKKSSNMTIPDGRVRQLKDQLIRAKVYLGIGPIRANPHLVRELRLRIKDTQRAVEVILNKGKQIQDDCAAVVKKLRAMVHSSEEQLRIHKKQEMFLTQLAAKTISKGLHCLPLRLSNEYFSLNSSQQQFPYQEKFERPDLYHYALFSDNILATAVVVNSTMSNANTIEEFTWLNDSYSPVLKQLRSQSMIDYYFRAHHATANSDANLKYRNPKYLSILNHLRFYLPEVFPRLSKVVFLDDDTVVQKDLTGLWKVDMKGKVNGAVETCGENFHRFDKYLNFSNPLIAKNFNPHACGWAYGMNVFDLDEWRKQKITEVYHYWQNLNIDRQLWRLGSLPPGLITFYNHTLPIDHRWHILGLGYNAQVDLKDIDSAAVIHYNGNMKPWLDIGLPKYRGYWSKYVNYDHIFIRDCNINP
ncbi:hypothetical protein BHM03_00016683 [Ensete ventricosum]|nr:hypothetical protein BHM03_00016683 [Ensete ventricosum]